MALATANGAPVLDASLRFPLQGAWAADMTVDSLEQLAGAVEIVIDDGALVLKGTAVRSGEFVDTARVSVTAGAGGLGKPATPRRYRNASVGIILRQLLATAGEALSPTASQAVLAKTLGEWTVLGEPIGAALSKLMSVAGASWRMLPDGTTWVGTETWPASTIEEDAAQVVDDVAEDGTMVIHVDRPQMLAGESFQGRHVASVHHHISPKGPVETTIWFDDGAGRDRLRAALETLVRSVAPKLDYRARYWGRVVGQAGGKVHVIAEDPQVGDLGDVLLANQAGDSIDGTVGGRVLVGWAAADPGQPYAEGFDGGTPAKRVIGAGAGYLGGDGPTASLLPLGTPLIAYLVNVAAAINAIVPGSVLPPDPTLLLAKKAWGE